MWVEKSREQLEVLRTRPFEDFDCLAVLIDGVRLAEELWVIVAVGIDVEGHKRVLDFEQGPSENATAVGALLERLAKRGLKEPDGRRLLVLRDGSGAIHKAVQQYWPSALQQECLVHAQSNVRDQVKRRDRADVDRHFKTLRQAQGYEAGAEAFEELLEFLSERNGAAAINLRKRKEHLLAFHCLEVPATLNRSFLSTNLIENVLRNWRAATGNVKRWREKSDMVSRWMASGLLWAEAGFRKLHHAEDLPHLRTALTKEKEASS